MRLCLDGGAPGTGAVFGAALRDGRAVPVWAARADEAERRAGLALPDGRDAEKAGVTTDGEFC